MPRSADYLGEWMHKPVVQNRVAEYLKAAGKPVLLAEVREALGLTRHNAQRVLARLYFKGFATRWKIPIERRNGFGRGTYQTYLYEYVGEVE